LIIATQKPLHINASGSLANTHLVIMQSATDQTLIGVGTSAPCNQLEVYNGAFSLKCFASGGTAQGGKILFIGCDDNSQYNETGQITSCLLSAATEAECGKMVFSLLFQGSCNNPALILCGCTSALTTNIRGPLCGVCGICVACGGAFGGNVGIGTATISHMLHVDAADGVASGCVVANIENNEASAGQNYGLYVKGGSNSSDYNSSFHDASGNVLMRIQGGGNVGIGTTAPGFYHRGTGYSFSPVKFGIVSDIDDEAIYVGNSSNDTSAIAFGAANASSEQVRIAHIMGEMTTTTDGAETGDLVFFTNAGIGNARRMTLG